MGSAADRLARDLERAEERIGELEDELARTKEALPWTEHLELPEEPDLPVPRLEMVWEEGSAVRCGYNYRCSYRLVYRHLLGHLVGVPLGETMVGSSRPPDAWGGIGTPFRDGAHIRSDAASLRLPAYVRWRDTSECIEPRPAPAETGGDRG